MSTTSAEAAYEVHASPIVAVPEIIDRWPEKLLTAMEIDSSEPVFAGHFPGFAIFPGICLVECAHRSALLALAQRPVARAEPRLTSLETVRFLNPVYPGDRVTVEVAVEDLAEDGWRCRARVLVQRQHSGAAPVEAAALKLRYAGGAWTR